MLFTQIENVPPASRIAKSACKLSLPRIAVCVLSLWLFASTSAAQSLDAAAINHAFSVSCDGYSSDELLIRDDLRIRFLRVLANDDRVAMPPEQERAALLRLLQLRKAGKLNSRATQQGSPVNDKILPVAEIAARVVTDRHRITSDTMLADPNYRGELQREAELLSPGIDAYSVRKAVLSLRKKRALRPELVLQVADWERKLQTLSLDALRAALQEGRVPEQPGIYLFRSAQGYLYIGEAANLSARLGQHTTASDRKSLAEYLSDNQSDVTVELHIFPTDSPARKVTVRRAYGNPLQSRFGCLRYRGVAPS